MNSILKKVLAPRYEYLTLDQNFIIKEISPGAQRFAECPKDLVQGEDIRNCFPELVGVEEILIDILEGRQSSFELKGIARFDFHELTNVSLSDNTLPGYLDLYISQYYEQEVLENRLIIFLEDSTERMVTQQVLAQKANEASLLLSALTASRNYIDRIISSIADALLVTTESGIIKTVNQSTESLFGYSQEELINQPITKLIKNQGFLEKINYLCSSYLGESLKDIEVTCQTQTGEEILVAFSCSAIKTDIDGLQNFVYIGRDITERRRVEDEMIKTLKQEKELRELKSRFVSMTSHEFRIPMTTIFSSTELLQHYGQIWTEDKKSKHYNRIKDAVKRMTVLLDDVLLISKAESGKLDFQPKTLLLKDFCSDLVEEIQLGAGDKHKIIFIYSGPCTDACMDEKLLLHILSNLLMNAVKYSPQDTNIRFSCNCQNGEVVFEIQDEGIGIPVEDQQRLFETFHRAKNVGDIPGTGLGLAIVQKSIDLHGGKITFRSEVRVGTTFRVTLPLNNRSKGHLSRERV